MGAICVFLHHTLRHLVSMELYLCTNSIVLLLCYVGCRMVQVCSARSFKLSLMMDRPAQQDRNSSDEYSCQSVASPIPLCVAECFCDVHMASSAVVVSDSAASDDATTGASTSGAPLKGVVDDKHRAYEKMAESSGELPTTSSSGSSSIVARAMMGG